MINSHIEGTTFSSDFIGGIIGNVKGDVSSMGIVNSKIISKGNIVGGILGSSTSGNTVDLTKLYTKNCYIEGNNKVGGIIGILDSGKVYNNYSNAEIVSLGENIGGISGYVKNEANNKMEVKQNNVAGSTITGKENVGGVIGKVDKELYSEEQFTNNYVEAYLTGENSEHVSLGIGSNKEYNERLKNMHVYQYSTINEENISTKNDIWKEEKYLKEVDLKLKSTYTEKLKWSTSDWEYSVLANNKYPILKGIADQEGIDIPKDSEHMVGENAEINTLDEQENTTQELKNETLQATFAYEGKKIETYETYTKITLEDGATVTRPERLYVKEGKLYILDGNLDMVVNNFIVDRYNGKEYETILGTDGKLYDLKESLYYPENFKNKDIKEIGNNLETEAKEITVVYQDGSFIRFNYQTGEVLEEKKVEQQVSLFRYIAEAFEKENVMLEPSKESYEASKDLIGKLEQLPIEEAKERKARDVREEQETSNGEITEQTNNNETAENSINPNEIIENETNQMQQESNNTINTGITSKEKKYISKYNSKTGEYEVYDKEEILESKEKEVISEEEKIEKENLSEYYSGEERTEENAGIVWIMLSIAGAIIILMILGRKVTVKKKKDPSVRKRR